MKPLSNHSATPTKSTSKPSFQPSSFPTQSPTNFPLIFSGLQDAYSSKKGEVTVLWQPPDVGEMVISETDLVYHLFIANSTFNFKMKLANETVLDLIKAFRTEAGLQYVQIQGGSSYNLTISSTDYGETKLLLMIVEMKGLFSKNTEPDEVVISRADSRFKEDIDLIGMFIPTDTIDISLEVASSGMLHTLVFSGTLSSIAQNLQKGNYITGFTTQMGPFIRRVVEVATTRSDKVVLKVLHALLEDIFDELDFAGTFSVTAKEGALSS